MWKCKHCHREFDFILPNEKANHSRWCDKNPKKKNYLDKLKETRESQTIEQRKQANKSIKKAWDRGDYENVEFVGFRDRTHTNESKKKISKGLKKSHLSGKHPGWQHVNENAKKSYPERYFTTVFENLDLYNKYEIKEHFPVGKYNLDFAFIDLKIDVEIDGEQHYRSEESIKHDRVRDEYLNSIGWKVYRIIWKSFLKNKINTISDFENFLIKDSNSSPAWVTILDI